MLCKAVECASILMYVYYAISTIISNNSPLKILVSARIITGFKEMFVWPVIK